MRPSSLTTWMLAPSFKGKRYRCTMPSHRAGRNAKADVERVCGCFGALLKKRRLLLSLLSRRCPTAEDATMKKSPSSLARRCKETIEPGRFPSQVVDETLWSIKVSRLVCGVLPNRAFRRDAGNCTRGRVRSHQKQQRSGKIQTFFSSCVKSAPVAAVWSCVHERIPSQ